MALRSIVNSLFGPGPKKQIGTSDPTFLSIIDPIIKGLTNYKF